jgi:hypothetical protein
MTPAQKRELIIELADRFWPAKVVAPLSEDLISTSFLCLELFHFDSRDEGTDGIEVAQRVQEHLGADSVIGRLVLEYTYPAGTFVFYNEHEPTGEKFSDETRSRLIDIVLNSLSEETIRERFAQFKSQFFTHMQSTPSDWHMPE